MIISSCKIYVKPAVKRFIAFLSVVLITNMSSVAYNIHDITGVWSSVAASSPDSEDESAIPPEYIKISNKEFIEIRIIYIGEEVENFEDVYDIISVEGNIISIKKDKEIYRLQILKLDDNQLEIRVPNALRALTNDELYMRSY